MPAMKPMRSVPLLVLALLLVGAGMYRILQVAAPAPEDGVPADAIRIDLTAVDAAAPDAETPATAAPKRSAYDPTELVRSGVPPGEVFLKEARDPAWAEAVEGVVGGRIRTDMQRLVPEARGVGISCRTLSCLVQIDAPAEKHGVALAVANLVTLGPLTVQLDPTEQGRAQFLFFTEPRMAEPEVMTNWYLSARKKRLTALRTGQAQNNLPFPAEQLPEE